MSRIWTRVGSHETSDGFDLGSGDSSIESILLRQKSISLEQFDHRHFLTFPERRIGMQVANCVMNIASD
jgi:hypothetical protein